MSNQSDDSGPRAETDDALEKKGDGKDKEASLYASIKLELPQIEKRLQDKQKARLEAIESGKESTKDENDIFHYELLQRVKNYSSDRLDQRIYELTKYLSEKDTQYSDPENGLTAQKEDEGIILEYHYAVARNLYDKWLDSTYAEQNELMFSHINSAQNLSIASTFQLETEVNIQKEILSALIHVPPIDQALSSYQKISLTSAGINIRIQHSQHRIMFCRSEAEKKDLEMELDKWTLQSEIRQTPGKGEQEQDIWINKFEAGESDQSQVSAEESLAIYKELLPFALLREWDAMSAEEKMTKIHDALVIRERLTPHNQNATDWQDYKNMVWDELVTAAVREFSEDEYTEHKTTIKALLNTHSYEQFPGIHVSDAPRRRNKPVRRDSQGILQPEITLVEKDEDFWQRLNQALTKSDLSVEEQKQFLIKEVKARREIPKVKGHEKNTLALKAMSAQINTLITEMTVEEIAYLDEHARSQLNKIAEKAGVLNAERYKFAKTGVYDSYEEQEATDRANKFIKRLEKEMEDSNSSYYAPLQCLRSYNGPNLLTSAEKKELGKTLVILCREEYGITAEKYPDQPIHEFIDFMPGTGIGGLTTPEGEIFVTEKVFQSTSLLLNALSHEVEHSLQQLQIAPTNIKSLPKEQQYTVRLTGYNPNTSTRFDHQYGKLKERKGYRQGMNVLIGAANSLLFNPNKEGIFCEMDASQSSGDILHAVARKAEEAIGMSLRDMLTRDYLLKPVIDVKGKKKSYSPRQSDDVIEAIHKLGKLCHQPWNPANIVTYALFSTMPAIVENAYGDNHVMQKQFRLIFEFIKDCAEEPKFTKISAFHPRLDDPELNPNDITKILRETAREYPDDLSRRMLTEVAWSQIKNRHDLPPDFTEKKVQQTINLIERRFPLPQK